ncbi:protease SohB [Idiomarina tyrosinivorans]|uniref:Protease SohB n=1 Tax=Idiomarina tyrosinivorans TaxID=1445662 RepID=A0A432ZPH4_9GAMM|nr:protease SohB [Idiomarina tyrosinivorans]RUO79736.1 protease SohB [Idiomarina tyrosinivorans]
MEFVLGLAGFVVKAIVIVVAIAIIIGLIAQAAQRQKRSKDALDITDLSEKWRDMRDELNLSLLDKKARKAAQKALKKADKQQQTPEHKLFVLNFKGSMDAKETEALRHEVNAIVSVATDNDQVLVKLESGGGTVNGYGFGAAQLQRLRDHGMQVHVAIDKVAASGGYMMACVAHHIYAAPFALVGSIGVVAQLPNFHRWLKKHDVDFEMLTAGEYKRTLTIFGENTDEGRRKFKQDLEAIHRQFKQFVQQHREQLDIDKVATGEVWTGQEAKEVGLVDELITSDAWLMKQLDNYALVELSYRQRKSLSERVAKGASIVVNALKSQLTQPPQQ